jgi:hypothetical protein
VSHSRIQYGGLSNSANTPKHLEHGLTARRGGVDALLMQEQIDTDGVDFR